MASLFPLLETGRHNHHHSPHHPPVVVLELTGILGAGTDAEFLDKVHSNLYEGHRAFVVNLSGVKHIDSTGLGTLLHLHAAVARSGGRMVRSHSMRLD